MRYTMTVILLLIMLVAGGVDGLILKRVFILSRHNIRAPLTSNLQRMTPHLWPDFATPVAHLTPKGALLESYIAETISKWLKEEMLLEHQCPAEDYVHIFANAPQRTKETAEAFAKAAFKNCDISVEYRDDVRMDPVFNPILRNTSESFKRAAFDDMRMILNNSNLHDAYKLLAEIIDLKNSEICKTESFCDLINRTDDILFRIGEEPNIYGPLSIGNSIVDVFLMSFYEGLPLKDIAWGKIIDANQWKLLSEITKGDQEVRFGSNVIAKDVAKPLLEYMKNVFLNESAPKLTVLFGHDSNFKSVMTSLSFKDYELPGQVEKTPIGGKLVFQKWYDEMSGRDLLKVNYLYQSVKQLRDGLPITEDNPLRSVVLYINKCRIVNSEFCLWEDFLSILKSVA